MSDETGAGAEQPAPPKAWHRWLRIGVIVLVAVILGVEAWLVAPHLAPAWESIGSIHWGWVAACIAVALFEMGSAAQVQRVLFRSADVRVSQGESLAVILASNSISQTMPGGQVLAPAFIYRESRKWGAAPVVASWQLVMSGLLAGVGLAVLGLGGAALAGAKTSPFSVIFSITGFLAFLALMQFLTSHPEIILALGRKVLAWFNDLRDKPAETGLARVERILNQLRSVKLTRRAGGRAFGWSLANWAADVACLAFACYAVGANPGFAGLMVAYAAGKAVGTAVPLLPGGIGVVDAVLVPALTSAGMSAGDALIAVIIYRVVTYVLLAVIGWVVIAFRYRTAISGRDDLRSEMEREESDIDPGAAPA